SVNGEIEVSLHVKADGSRLEVGSGAVGALLEGREGSINRVIDELDTLAGELIFQVNRIHSTGVSETGYTSLTGSTPVAPQDTGRALNSPQNLSLAELPFSPQHGS